MRATTIVMSWWAVVLAAGLGGCSSDGQGPAVEVRQPGSCDPACGATEVCSAGRCITPGPAAGCGDGPFAEGLPASGVLFVDASRAGAGAGDGSQAKPFATIGEALAASAGGDTVAVAAGVYDEALTIDRDLTLRCRCPAKVRIARTIEIAASANDLVVTIAGCTVAPSDVAATGSLAAWGSCAAATGDGVAVAAGPEHAVELAVRDSVVAGWCAGVRFNAATASSSALCISRSRLHANRKGLELLNAPLARLTAGDGDCAAVPEAVAVVESRLDDNADAAVFTRKQARGIGLASNLIVGGGTLGGEAGADKAAGLGIYLGDTSSAHIVDNRIADNLAVGIGVINADEPAGATTFAIEDNLLSGNRGAGIALQQLQASQAVRLVGNLVQDTAAGDEPGGDGILISVEQGRSYEVLLEGNTVSGSARHGALLIGVGGAVGGNAIEGSGGYGLLLQRVKTIELTGNLLTDNGAGDQHESGDSNPLEKYGALPLPLP